MGYRSQIMFACRKDQIELIQAAMELKPDEIHGTENNDGEIFRCEWHDYKWGYGQTDQFENIMGKVEPVSTKIDYYNEIHPYGFIRIGEDDEDIEYFGDPHEYGIQFTRILEWWN